MAAKKPEKDASPQAREKLLAAGVKIFALYGFEGASTRQLAKEAGVNISAILYYFNGKEGFYAAVLAQIAQMAQGAMQERALKIRAALTGGNPTPAECREFLHGFMEGLTRFLLSEKATAHMGRIFIREQMDPTPAFDGLYETTIKPMHETVTALVARLTGLSGAEAVLAAQSLIGQAIIFKTHREVALRRTGWKDYGEKEVGRVIALVRRQTDAIIDSYQTKKVKP